MQFDRGYQSPYFKTNAEKMVAELNNPLFFLVEKKSLQWKNYCQFRKKFAQQGKLNFNYCRRSRRRSFRNFGSKQIRGSLKIAAVKAPGFGDRRKAMLEDIAILTGGQVVSEERGFNMDNVTIEMLGRAEKVTIDKDNTTIVNGAGNEEEIKGRSKPN